MYTGQPRQDVSSPLLLAIHLEKHWWVEVELVAVLHETYDSEVAWQAPAPEHSADY